MSSPLVWGVGIVAVGYAGYTVYQRVTRREPPPPPAQGPNEEDGEGVEPIVGPPPPSTATAAPEIRRTVSGERVGRRNSQGATPVLSGRGREGSVDPMPDLPPPAVAPPPTPPAIPRVAEEHEHLTAPVPHIEDNTVAAQQVRHLSLGSIPPHLCFQWICCVMCCPPYCVSLPRACPCCVSSLLACSCCLLCFRVHLRDRAGGLACIVLSCNTSL